MIAAVSRREQKVSPYLLKRAAAGARMLNHESYWKVDRPASLKVATSGRTFRRLAPVTARARTLPLCTRSPADEKNEKPIATSPRMMAVCVSGSPRKATCTMSVLVVCLNRVPAMPVVLPGPAEL